MPQVRDIKGVTLARKARGASAHLPDGWTRIQLQVPDHIAEAWDQVREAMPQQSLKCLGTAAISAFVALPSSAQLALYRWANSQMMEPHEADPMTAVVMLVAAINALNQPAIRPTESKGGKVVRIVSPPVQRDGYSEQVIRELEIDEPGGDDPAAGGAAAEGA